MKMAMACVCLMGCLLDAGDGEPDPNAPSPIPLARNGEWKLALQPGAGDCFLQPTQISRFLDANDIWKRPPPENTAVKANVTCTMPTISMLGWCSLDATEQQAGNNVSTALHFVLALEGDQITGRARITIVGPASCVQDLAVTGLLVL